MSSKPLTTDPFFKGAGLTPEKAREIVREGLSGADYGEFYHEIVARERLVKDKGEFTTVSTGDSKEGFGVRVGQGERVGYAFSDLFNEAALTDAVREARNVLKPGTAQAAQKPSGMVPQQLYTPEDPMAGFTLAEKISKINEIEAFCKTLDNRIANVTVQYVSEAKAVHIITAEGKSLLDNRPMTSLAISIMLTDENGKSEIGTAQIGGHVDAQAVFDETEFKAAARKALHQAKELLVAEDAPAGIMDVVLSPGWAAVVLHEAIGHGLEGDFNRRDISVYSGKLGQQIASPEVTVIDQGDMPGERGSLHFDDEGTPTQANVLIENGVLKGYMQDRQNAQLMGVDPTGNGRRESYAHAPMPRMTNTYFANGTHDPADIIKSVKDGLYIADMGGGQVDITSGKFNMNAKLAYRIRDGKIAEPVKGATIVGDGLTVIKSITMVGNDLALEKSAGMCGKNGQSVPVGCGQPTLRVSNMTVGGRKR
ncbi:MAG TPA: metallopeptidase TldD-related protein [Patescibacteria group bacterium]|nr:metallopeptidase TldD-related protein [Patescibacteria group bacterium]